jgi:hypothetical protein
VKSRGEGVALESRPLALDPGFELEDIDLEGRELTKSGMGGWMSIVPLGWLRKRLRF